MSNVFKTFSLVIISSFLLIGCGAVEWQHKHPSLKKGEAFALLNEEGLYADNITSTIKGFYENRNLNPDEIKEPVLKDYSTGKSIMKGLYTVSPYGWMTLPFADFEGRTIAIPAREIGIVMHRRYYKESLRKEIVTLKVGDMTSAKSENLSDLRPMGKVGTVIYQVKFENLEWDDQLWFNPLAGEDYELILSKGIIRNSKNMVVAGKEVSKLPMPSGMQPESGEHVVTGGGVVLGKRHIVTVDGKIFIFDDNGDISASVISKQNSKSDIANSTFSSPDGKDFLLGGKVISDSGSKAGSTQQFHLTSPTLTSLDGKDVILTGPAPDGQAAKLIIPSGKGFASATLLSADTNEQLKINTNKWINSIMETSDIKYVGHNLLVTPTLNDIGKFSLTELDVEMVNNKLKSNGFKLSVFSSGHGLEATRTVF